MESCDILLATYNGEEYIGELLESLLAQTHQDFRLIVRDDGSKDSTLSILAEFEPRFAGRLVIIGYGVPSGSPTLNFEILMQQSTADHVLFCDQDDVWLPNRVGATLKLLADAEKLYGPTTPVFAFNDLIPVDRNLNKLARSFWDFKKINPEMAHSLPKSLITSPILGCSSGINRALLTLALPIHPQATNHDWWTLHVAIIFGKVVWSDEKTVLYRLHGGNSSNQKRVSLKEYAKSANKFARVRNGLTKKSRHAEGLLQTYQNRVPSELRRLLEDFSRIKSMGFFRRRLTLLKWGLIYPDIRRNVAFLLGL